MCNCGCKKNTLEERVAALEDKVAMLLKATQPTEVKLDEQNQVVQFVIGGGCCCESTGEAGQKCC